jgi:polyribonucleotide nucleotidyltransferase
MTKIFRLDELGYEVEIGKFAGQAHGAAWLKRGGTIVLSTVVTAPTQEFLGFLPLTVDYREQFSAAGKIPGGYYKREGRASDKEILTSRLIDRAIRPLFPVHFFDQVQVLNTVYSLDREHMPQSQALLAASIALTISKIPFLGPVGVVEIARINDQWIVEPTFEQAQQSAFKLVVAGTAEGVCMLEGCFDQVPENELLNAIFFAHETIKKQVEWQLSIAQELGVEKQEVSDEFNWIGWENKITGFLTDDKLAPIFGLNKIERNTFIESLKLAFHTECIVPYLAQSLDDTTKKEFSEKKVWYAFDDRFKALLTDLVIRRGKRVDNRDFEQVRQITVEVGLLPFAHGSSLFKRGNTQALTSVTLGSAQDEQRVEELTGETHRNFMLHYNFPPFSAGECAPQRGPGRREVGHGYLATSAVKSVLPSKEEFPYTIRIITDILESDGSTSMATTCGAVMAMMNAGVPIKKMVSGVAMGLLKGEGENNYQAITDISGFEDAFGWMDFKVTGGDQGVTAIQMDIKHKGGFSRSVFEIALDQARRGRQHILAEMRKLMTEPSKELSQLVPKIISFKIAPDKIGAVIGSGGKIIREIIEVTKTTIDIEDDGLVKIFATPDALAEKAVRWVKTLAGDIEPGAVYDGLVRRVVEFGIFVELVPGQDGLLHISNFPRDKQKDLVKDYPIDMPLKVRVVDYDSSTGRIRLALADR